MSPNDTVIFECVDNVGIITLNRPDAANGINLAMAQALMAVSHHCANDDSIRCVLLNASGKVFSAGGDVKAFYTYKADLSEKIQALIMYLHTAVSTLYHMQKPIVVAVNGMTAGAGLSLAMAGDIVVSAQSAKYTVAYTGVGLTPDAGTSYFLPKLVGLRRAQHLLLTNPVFSAQDALSWGLITETIADESLQTHSFEIARGLANGPTQAFGQVRSLLHTSNHASLDEQLKHEALHMKQACESQDAKEGIAAFNEKRTPQFTGQ